VLPLWVASLSVLIGSPEPSAQALVVSGGVSLGAYQAGFLYYLDAAGRAQHPEWDIPLVVGASAGSANGFLAALAACLPPEPDPRESLGWKVWAPIGFEELYDPDDVRREGLFSRRELVAATEWLWSRLARGLPQSCDFVVGLSTTRLKPLEVELEGGLHIPRQEEKFIVRVQGRGEGRPVRFSNYVDPYSDIAQPILPFEEGDDLEVAHRNFERFRTVLFGSMAFPVAFPPQWIAHCLTDPPDQTRYVPTLDYACPRPQRTDAFVDGSVLDNAPLRLAHTIAETGLREEASGRRTWRELTVSGWTDRRPPFGNLDFIYVDPSLTVYPATDVPAEGAPSTDALDLARELFGNFVYVARAKELYTLIEDRSAGSLRTSISQRFLPTAGDPLYLFMGFFERGFREFDFYLGMLDAYRHRAAAPGDRGVPFGALASGPEGVPEAWRPFACLLGWTEPGREALRSTCEGPEMRDFRILLQVSMDRLWDQCRRFGVSKLSLLGPHPQCRAAASGAPVLRVLDHPRVGEADRRARGEWHAKYALRRLAAYEFEFRDLGLGRDEATRAQAVLRKKMIRAFTRLGAEQESEFNRLVLGGGGRILANHLAYESPTAQAVVLVGTALEGGAVLSPFDRWRSWFRLDLSLQARGWLSILAPEEAYIALAAVAGPEVLVPFLTGSIAQTSLAFRAGYQLSSRDAFLTDPCRPRSGRVDPRHCSQTVLQPLAIVSFLDRFRLQLGVDIFPEPRDEVGDDGLEFDVSPWALSLGAGVTFF
jgi:hypothetical protein